MIKIKVTHDHSPALSRLVFQLPPGTYMGTTANSRPVIVYVGFVEVADTQKNRLVLAIYPDSDEPLVRITNMAYKLYNPHAVTIDSIDVKDHGPVK